VLVSLGAEPKNEEGNAAVVGPAKWLSCRVSDEQTHLRC
jgi:hypothetical protein